MVRFRRVAAVLLVAATGLILMSSLAFAEDPEPFEPLAEAQTAITDLIASVGPVVLTIIGAALGLAAGVALVRIGWRWVRGFLGGR